MDDSVDIRINAQDLQLVKLEYHNGNKIKAIQHLRRSGKAYANGEVLPKIGLKHAKDAVEHMCGAFNPAARSNGRPSATLSIFPRIKKVIIDIGADGDVECDLDGLQLRLLDGLDTIPLAAIAPAMELMQLLRDFDNNCKDAS